MTTTALVKPGLRTIRLYGALAKIVGCRKLRAVVSSVSEAMRFLLANFPQIEGYLKGRFFKVKVAGIALTEDDLKLPIGQTEEIHIIPAISGAGGNNGLTQILTGVALVGIGLLVPFTAPFLVPLGIGLTLTGVATLLTPTPLDREESTDAAQSYNFSGVQQTSREGPPVPLVYGEIITGSVALSVNIDRDDEKLKSKFFEGPGSVCRKYYLEVYMSDAFCTGVAGDTILSDTSGGFLQATIPTISPANSLECTGGSAPKGAQGVFTKLISCAGNPINIDEGLVATGLLQGGRQYAGHRLWEVDDGLNNYNNPLLVDYYERSSISPLPPPIQPGLPTDD